MQKTCYDIIKIGVGFLLMFVSPQAELYASNLTDDNASKATFGVPSKLFAKLRQGSYVLHRQHALAHRRQNPNNSESLDHCSKQRYLPDEGKIQPRHIGGAIRRLNIPIVTVNSSPYWRCVDTAEMAFGPTARAPDLRFTISINAEDTRCLLEALRILLPTAARAGSNAVLVSHTGYPNEVAAIWPKPEGVLGVFNLLGGNQFKYLGLITPEQWA